MGNYLYTDTSSPVQPPSLQEALGIALDTDTGQEEDVIQRNIVISVDASPQAESAFEWYVRHVHRPTNVVHVVHCYEVESPSGKHYPDYAIPPEHWSEKLDQARSHGDTILTKYQRRLEELQVNGKTHNAFGKPGHEIVTTANRLNASMIVMGTRGMGLLGRTFLGSISDYVVHHANTPVTVVPRRPAQNAE